MDHDGDEGPDVLRASVGYAGEVSAIGAARDFVAAFLQRVRAVGVPVPEQRLQAARLVVSELVTNAVRHAPGPCRLDVELRAGLLEITVSDTSRSHPAARPRDPGRIGQHGLEIVLALCHSVEDEPTPTGKRVRVCVSMT